MIRYIPVPHPVGAAVVPPAFGSDPVAAREPGLLTHFSSLYQYKKAPRVLRVGN
jgi:hypothetical protein